MRSEFSGAPLAHNPRHRHANESVRAVRFRHAPPRVAGRHNTPASSARNDSAASAARLVSSPLWPSSPWSRLRPKSPSAQSAKHRGGRDLPSATVRAARDPEWKRDRSWGLQMEVGSGRRGNPRIEPDSGYARDTELLTLMTS